MLLGCFVAISPAMPVPAAEPLETALRAAQSTGRVLVVRDGGGPEPSAIVSALADERGHDVAVLTLGPGDDARVVGPARWLGAPASLDAAVRTLRQVRPDVVLVLGHDATATLFREAWHAAADPARFPEQIAAGLRPWQTAKLYRHAEHGRGVEVTVAGGERFALLASALPAGAPEAEPLDGIDTSLPGLLRVASGLPRSTGVPAPGTADVVRMLEPGLRTLAARLRAASAAAAGDPSRAVPALRTAVDALRYWREQARALPSSALRDELVERILAEEPAFEAALAAAHGLTLTVRADAATVVPGQSLGVHVALRNDGPAPVTIERLHVDVPPGFEVGGGAAPGTVVAPGKSLAARLLVRVPASSNPATALAARVSVEWTTGGIRTAVRRDVADAAGRRPAVVAVAELDLPRIVVLPVPRGRAQPFDVAVAARDNTAEGGPARIELSLPEAWRVEPAQVAIGLAGAGKEARGVFRVVPPSRIGPGRTELRAHLRRGTATLAHAASPLVAVDVQLDESARVAVAGEAPALAAALARLGVPVMPLPPGALQPAGLEPFTVIVLEPSAGEAAAGDSVLREWVASGGHVLAVAAGIATPERKPVGRGTWTSVGPSFADELAAGAPEAWSLLARLVARR